MYKNYLPLTARFPFSETSNLLVAGMRRTSNWTEPERDRKVKREDKNYETRGANQKLKQKTKVDNRNVPFCAVKCSFHT